MTRIVLTVNCPPEYETQHVVKQIQNAILTRPYFGYYHPECFIIHVEESKEQADASDIP